jgi:ribosomal protein S18 acetylase RimI-like enzyme
VAWGLPGFVALDQQGRMRGMVYYLLEDDRLDIGGLLSDSDAATDVLLDGVITVAQAMKVQTVRGLLFDSAVALPSSMRMRAFDTERHLYLSRTLNAPQIVPSPAQRLWARIADRPAAGAARAELTSAWRTEDIEPSARLLSRAYDRESGRLFAPHHDAGEWIRYVRNLVSHVGCGIVNPALSHVLRDGDEVRALALITDIAPGVAHLVQLAVDPALRGERLGEALVQRACDGLRAAGYSALTLLVAEGNTPARAIYDRAGFLHDATFLAGTLDVASAPVRVRPVRSLATAS